MVAMKVERMKLYLINFLYKKSVTLLFLIESCLFTERVIDYLTMAAIFTEDIIHTLLQGDVQMDLTKATADALATEGIAHPRDLGGF